MKAAAAAGASRGRAPPSRRRAERVRLADAGKLAVKAPATFAQPCARISLLMSGRAPRARALTASSRVPRRVMARDGTKNYLRRLGLKGGRAETGHIPTRTPARAE